VITNPPLFLFVYVAFQVVGFSGNSLEGDMAGLSVGGESKQPDTQ
jgi:hypothetical protein